VCLACRAGQRFSPEGTSENSQRFNAGNKRARRRVPSGTTEAHGRGAILSSLRDLSCLRIGVPALKRWAFFFRPYGLSHDYTLLYAGPPSRNSRDSLSSIGSAFSVRSEAASAAPVSAPPTRPCVRRGRRTERTGRSRSPFPTASFLTSYGSLDLSVDKNIHLLTHEQ
jgi:hypothetical protein